MGRVTRKLYLYRYTLVTINITTCRMKKDDPENMKLVSPLNIVWRFYVYAVHGYFAEIMFTAIWEFIVTQNWKFLGTTSIWTFVVYGIWSIVMEQLYLNLHFRFPLLIRALIYMGWTYSWEFSIGYLLRCFNACPWDYTPFDGNFMGLVTLEYAPLWFIGSILTERLMIKYTRTLHWGPSLDLHERKLGNVDITTKCN